MTKAPLGGPFGDAAVGPNATDRGRLGVKRSLRTAADGVLLAVVGAGADAHDKTLLATTLDAIVTDRPVPSRRHPQRLGLDKGYDYADSDDADAARGYRGHISRRGEDPRPRRAGPGQRVRRWVVERPHSWLNRSRRCPVRREKKRHDYLAFGHLAYAQLLFSRVARLLG